MKKFIVIVLLLVFFTGLKAQKNYTTALGVKFYPTGITIKHFISDKHSLEGIGYFFHEGTRITGLYELNFPIGGLNGLNWYVGPGAHVGLYNTKYGGGSAIGVDGVLGLDYKIADAPINISLDWQPSFEFGDKSNQGFAGNWGGIGIRYVF
ncbi:hypothetical protein BH09BAC2_BH09BAC2_11860 [soil metagenome]